MRDTPRSGRQPASGCRESCCRPRPNALADRVAEQTEREAFAQRVLLFAATRPAEICPHADCEQHSNRRINDALTASVERISADRQALTGEQILRQRKEVR